MPSLSSHPARIRHALLVAVAAWTTACGGRLASGETLDDVLLPGPLVLAGTPGAVVSPNYRAAFRTLEAAIHEDDDVLAHAILTRLEASPLTEEERALADNLRRVLEGRELARAVRLELFLRPAAEPDRWELAARLGQDVVDRLELRLPPGRLTHRRNRLDELGISSRETRTLLLSAFEEVELLRDQTTEIALVDFDVPMRAAVALRDEWSLELLAGTILAAGDELPAAAFPDAALEQTYLASFLPQEPLEPEVLVEYARREEPALPPLIERAVRIPSARHDEALEALEPLLLELVDAEPERMVRLAPALRWLARTTAPGVDPASWVVYIRARRDRHEREAARLEDDRRRLELPLEEIDLERPPRPVLRIP